ncbi:zf-MYND domain-containing protein [Pyrenophora tritici-repentis]|nr:zf-MYND domain-containing protein [Pyrenophora tritici-repentis]KAI0590019.1 zf-MYND domain-containing protein [Pyrenophora tritici-repentis]KAI0612878.1 zf-MYND domain-containing protein [Pyrenophora tritici-repentis]KAI0625147.1 zf-MYND domain-containing protein [Pyrenophora tritici-repentis]
MTRSIVGGGPGSSATLHQAFTVNTSPHNDRNLSSWVLGVTAGINLALLGPLCTDTSTGLFQSDHDFNIVENLTSDAGLYKLEENAKAIAKAKGKSEKDVEGVSYLIYGPACSHLDSVRKHLDGGILADLIAKKEAKMLGALAGSKEEMLEYWMEDPCYVYVLLGACAMTLGCRLPDTYVAMLKKVYTEGGLMPQAQQQIKKALFGPNGYVNGVPYDIESKTLTEEADSRPSEPDNGRGYQLMNVMSPGGIFNTGMTTSSTSTVIKELRDQRNKPNVCGNCEAKRGPQDQALLICAKCKNRSYCSVDCQKKAWKVHKKVCVAPKVSL